MKGKLSEIVVFFICMFTIASAQTSSDVRRLLRDLFKNYDSRVRPVLNQQKPITLDIRYDLESIDELDIKKQVLRSKGYLTFEWFDELLCWNVSDYGGLSKIFVSQSSLWLPDFVLNNQYKGKERMGSADTFVSVSHSGKVSWFPAMVFPTMCNVNIRYYPFDTQICFYQLLPWMYDNLSVTLPSTLPDISSTFMIPSSEFDVKSLPSKVIFIDDPLYNVSFASVKFSLSLRRKRTFYWLTMILPLIAFPFLYPVSFLIPASSGEKITLSVTILLTFLVFNGLINDSLPKLSTTVSICVLYTSLQTITSLITVVANGVIIYIDGLSPSSKPPLLLRLLEGTIWKGCKLNGPSQSVLQTKDSQTPERVTSCQENVQDENDNMAKYDYKTTARKLDDVLFYLSLGFAFLTVLTFCFVLLI